MGLSKQSVGVHAIDSGLHIRKHSPDEKIIAIAGNPNVGKSTLFNSLTGLNQHTGNWPGKTVSNAQGSFKSSRHSYILVDIPGTYSLMAHSTEEEVARNFICFGKPDAIIIVCDATCLERNLNLVLQTMEITKNVIVCVNLMDEAKRKHIKINLKALSKELGVPVVGTVARDKRSLSHLTKTLDQLIEKEERPDPLSIQYELPIEDAIDSIQSVLPEEAISNLNPRWLSLKLLDYDYSLIKELKSFLHQDITTDSLLSRTLEQEKSLLASQNITFLNLQDKIVAGIMSRAEQICRKTVIYERNQYDSRDRKIDKLLTSKRTGYPVMIVFLAFVFWLTITGANYPSNLLSRFFAWLQIYLTNVLHAIHAPDVVYNVLILGIYRVLTWVIAVMLPPMAIFFPLFTLLEDAGYLPRIAYNLDKHFKQCCACGKQALTMCMGFGCNAAGIVGCRIIDSPRERLIAMITNNFVPCNGRFPTLIAIITMFFVGVNGGAGRSALSALILTAFILLGIFMTFMVSKLLSHTILKGIPSSFTLELPPYRKPQFGKVLVHSLIDRTLFVLGRAIVVAAPAGLVIWIMANVSIGDISLLAHCANFLDPFAKLLGLDGVILIAFILGFPANEIVLPIIIMAYLSEGSLVDMSSLTSLRQLLVDNGWTWITAISTMLFSLMHWPCSTTMLTIKKESESWKWTVLSFLIPTVVGCAVCFVFANVARLFCR